MSHAADKWIESRWMGKCVRQVRGEPAAEKAASQGLPNFIGREGVVEETFFDEKGALHCRIVVDGADWWWCPAAFLDLVG